MAHTSVFPLPRGPVATTRELVGIEPRDMIHFEIHLAVIDPLHTVRLQIHRALISGQEAAP